MIFKHYEIVYENFYHVIIYIRYIKNKYLLVIINNSLKIEYKSYRDLLIFYIKIKYLIQKHFGYFLIQNYKKQKLVIYLIK